MARYSINVAQRAESKAVLRCNLITVQGVAAGLIEGAARSE